MANKYELRRRAIKESRDRYDNLLDSPRGSRETERASYVPPPPMDRGPLTLWLSMGLVVLVCVLYMQTARHQFTVCDDNVYIYEKPQIISGLTWENVKWAFSDAHEGNWHPLTWISHMIDWQLFGTWQPENKRYVNSWPGGHHLISMLIHCANAVLLFLALRLMTGTLWPCFVVAALFAVHPLRVESVAWSAERKDVLCGLFWMASLLAYAIYTRRRQIRATSFAAASGIAAILCILFVRLLVFPPDPARHYTTPEPFTIPVMVIFGLGVIAAIVVSSLRSTSPLTQAAEIGSYLLITTLFALGLMAKSMIVTLPCVFLLLDIWPLGRWKKALQSGGSENRLQTFLAAGWLLLEKIPWFLLAYLDSTYTIYGQDKGVALNSLSGLPMGPRILNAVVASGEYLRQMAWPTGLAPFYCHPHMIPDGWTSTVETQIVVYGVLFTLITALAVVALVKNLNWRVPSLTAAWFGYLCALMPTIALLQTWTCHFKRKIAQTSSANLTSMIRADAISVLQERQNVIFAYSLLLLALGAVAVVATIKKWRWASLAVGWFWFLGILTPVVGHFQGWTTAFLLRLTLHGIELALITAFIIVAILKKWGLPWLAAGWFWYLGALVPLLGFLDQWDNLVHAEVLLQAAVLSPLVAGAVAALSKKWSFSFLTVGWFWYIGALVPVVGIIQVGTQGRADRYTYLPMIGVYLVAAWLLKAVADRWPDTRRALAFASVAALLALSAVTFRQVSYWLDSYKLFEHAAEVTEKNYFAYNHIGIAFDKDAKDIPIDPKKANELFTHVSQYFQGPPKKLENARNQLLADCPDDKFPEEIKKLNRDEQQQLLFDYSAQAFKAAIDIKPDYDFGNNNLGVYYARQGGPEDLKLAEKYFRGALVSNPRYADAFNNLAIVLARQGKLDEAIYFHKEGLKVRYDRASDHNNLCHVYMQKDDLENAATENKISLQCDPNFVSAWMARAEICVKQKNLADAAECVERIIKIDPRVPEVGQGLGLLVSNYLALNRPDEAIDFLDKMQKINDALPPIYYLRAMGFIKKFEMHQARADLAHAQEDFEQTLRIAPGFPGAAERVDLIRKQLAIPQR